METLEEQNHKISFSLKRKDLTPKHQKYLDYINKSNEWQIKRQKAFKMKGRACQKCKSKYNLQVHHATYIRLYEENIETDLFILCNSCHNNYHESIKGGTSIRKTKNYIKGNVIEKIKLPRKERKRLRKEKKHEKYLLKQSKKGKKVKYAWSDNSHLFNDVPNCLKCSGVVFKKPTTFHRDNSDNRVCSYYWYCKPCRFVIFPKHLNKTKSQQRDFPSY